MNVYSSTTFLMLLPMSTLVKLKEILRYNYHILLLQGSRDIQLRKKISILL